ncbi:MAG: hypothetical protein QXW10_04460 [Candidatus Micrarchaeaceae archaeon]
MRIGIGSKGRQALSAPIFIKAKNLADAARLSSISGLPALLASKGGLLLYDNSATIRAGGYAAQRVKNGLEAAKLLRAADKVLPFITPDSANDSGQILKQLKIAMFLTNSSSVEKLKKAPIYVMGNEHR